MDASTVEVTCKRQHGNVTLAQAALEVILLMCVENVTVVQVVHIILPADLGLPTVVAWVLLVLV